MLADRPDLGDDAVVDVAEPVEDAGRLVEVGGLLDVEAGVKVLVEEVAALAHEGVGVDVVDAGEEEVVGVDQVVGDGREVRLDADEEAPAEVEHFPGGARGFPEKIKEETLI